ncbi:MAG: D-alanyl-D-alanine carboxypeptidase/D-alanyl-D-alanine-endopeptidase [Fluviicola sp.]|nr:D-alanyl-D-alanine carboxypeptidase/D-alanyl-D-alanine-endopeptidase [Fluviicola sp.]
MFFPLLRHLILTGILLVVGSGWSQNSVQSAVDVFANDPVFANASVGFLAIDVATGEVIASKNPATCLSPASTVKLFSTATAFQVLGSDYAPKTRIYIDGTIDANGIVNGNLWIRGGGDVAIGSRYYNAEGIEDTLLRVWADTLLKMGIKQINGAIIADASEFGYQGVPDGWSWSDMGNYYGAGPSGLPIYDNMLRYVFQTGASGGKTTLKETIPTIPGFSFHNYISSGGSGDNSYIYGAPYSLDRFGTGTLEAKVNRIVVKGSLPDPEWQFAQEFLRILKGRGVTVRDSINTARQLTWASPSVRYGSMKMLLEHKGKTVGSVAWWTNMKSVNLFAEELLCWVGYAAYGTGSTDNGVTKLENYWTGKIPVSGMFIKDGSGLSRGNAISPRHFCDLLKFMTTSKNFDVFYGTLPVAGISGTLSSVCKNQAAEGKIHAKSGTMNRIKSYCGYAETKGGKRIAFAFIANNYNCTSNAVVDRMEKVFNAMALY